MSVESRDDAVYMLEELFTTELEDIEYGFEPSLLSTSKPIRVSSYEEAMVVTLDKGIVLTFEDGNRLFLTVHVDYPRG